MFKAGDGARGNAGSSFEVLGSNAREREALDTITGLLPGLASNTEQSGLARSGIADDRSDISALGDVPEGEFLFFS